MTNLVITLSGLVRRRPISAFFVLVYALSSLILPLLFEWLMPGYPGYFGPAVAAIIIIAVTQGRAGLKKLVVAVTQWRVGPIWYLFVISLPIFASLSIIGIEILLGAPAAFKFEPEHPLALVVSMIALGEEVGWRGYALPKLMERFSPLTASLILGLAWGFYHLPPFLMSGVLFNSLTFPAVLIYFLSVTIIFTWQFMRTKGSALLATLLHASINTFGFFNPLVEDNWWIRAGAYFIIAVLVVIAVGPATFLRKPRLNTLPDVA